MVNLSADSSAAPAPHRREAHSIGYNLAVIGVAVALAGLAVAYGIVALTGAGRGSGPAGSPSLSRTLGSTKLTIPAGWFREGADEAGGFAKKVELAFTLPLGPKGARREIDVTLLPRSQARPSASLLDGVYLHQFMPEQLSGPPGLIGKPLMAQDGFANETVWYDALSSAPFVAKCLAPLAEGQPGRCLRTVYLGPGIAAVYSFGDDVLGNWQAFDAQLQPLFKQIGAL